MASGGAQVDVYLEVGRRRVFAGALDRPGWCRGGRNARILSRTNLAFTPPGDPAAYAVAERLEGNSTTDFGAPDGAPACDWSRSTRRRASAPR